MEEITLDEDQIKAYKSLKRALKKCRDAEILFYQLLHRLHLLNGRLIGSVGVDTHIVPEKIQVNNVCDMSYDVITTEAFADDDAMHFVEFK